MTSYRSISTRRERFWGRVHSSAWEGFWYGLAFCAIAIIRILVLGPGPLARVGIALPVVLVLYLMGGISVGAICGALEPFERTLQGRIVMGMLAALPICFLASFTLLPASESPKVMVLTALLLSVVWGVVGGTLFWFTRD